MDGAAVRPPAARECQGDRGRWPIRHSGPVRHARTPGNTHPLHPGPRCQPDIEPDRLWRYIGARHGKRHHRAQRLDRSPSRLWRPGSADLLVRGDARGDAYVFPRRLVSCRHRSRSACAGEKREARWGRGDQVLLHPALAAAPCHRRRSAAPRHPGGCTRHDLQGSRHGRCVGPCVDRAPAHPDPGLRRRVAVIGQDRNPVVCHHRGARGQRAAVRERAAPALVRLRARLHLANRFCSRNRTSRCSAIFHQPRSWSPTKARRPVFDKHSAWV